VSESHTPGPWVVDNAKWGACQWGTMPDDERGEPNLAGGVLPVIAVFRCPENDDHDLCVRSRRVDQQDRIAWTDEERWGNANLIAAAPELLAACKKALAFFRGDYPGLPPVMETDAALVAAIAKAGGAA